VAVDVMVNMRFQRILILCPKSVVQVWPAEIAKHAAVLLQTCPLDDGSVIQRTRKMTAFLDLQAVRGEPAVVILNYDSAWREPMGSHLLRREWDVVICDESHRIKAPGGKAAMFCSRLGDHVPHRMCLTGTPMPHSPLDVYAQYRFLDKGLFGTSFVNFRARYAVMGGFNGKQVLSYQNQQELHERFYSLAYRVKSEDVQSLPEAIDVIRPVTLGAYARSLYDTLKKEFVVGIGDGTVTAGNALTRLLRLQQIGSGWARQDRNIETGEEGALVQVDQAKQDVLADLMEDLTDDEPVVVFCRFHHDLDAVHTVAAALARDSRELSGRRNELGAWQSGEAPILAVQIQSGGVGINLVRARYCVFYSLGFSLGEYLQARKRTHRPGQDRSVTYFHLIATKTVDEDVYQALEARQDVIETILTKARP
jgi:SNF2 family DNA or RNA helicase